MKIAFNPSTVEALITPPNNKDITFDLRGRNIFARGVKFCGTDTWRDIKINNVSIGSNILDLRNGSNTTLINTNGVVTINSTWRPVVDNLTSDSTTSSLSAKQGKVLKSLIDGKSNSGHTHDDRYLKLTGGTMASNALITFADSGSLGTDKEPQGARGGLYWTGQSDYAKLYAEETAGDNLDLVIQFGDDNSNGLSIRNKANTQTSYISASGVITTGTFKGNLDWSYITNKPATATRWPSWAEVTGKPSSFTPSTHTHGLSNSVFFLNMPSISGNAKWKEVFGYPVNYNLLLSVRINSPAPEWCVGNYGSGILYGGSDTKGFMSSAYNEPLIMWAGGNGSSDDSVPKWYIGIKGIHKSIYNLATIASEANAAYNLRHSHSNKSVLDGITSALVNNWNTAFTFVNTITGTDTNKVINKWDEIVNFLAGITEDNKLNTLLNSKLSVYELANNTNVGTIKNNGIYYSTTDASSGTLTNSPFNTGFALINMTSLDNGDDLRRSRLAFNAYGEIKVSDDRDQANTAETWYNVLTSKNSGISGSTIKLNGTSITVYSSSTADGRYVKKSGDTMSGALNFANNTWNKVGDDSYVGDCNVSGHFGIKAANTTYPGIAFFNNSGAHLGNLTAYNGNIKYGAYSLRFLDNGNTSVGASTWTNPFSGYNSNAVADGQAICVWGQSSSLSNLAADSGDISLWLKRVNAKAATLNMVLDGEYYANGNLRLAHVSEIPNSLKNPYSLTTFGVVYDGSAAKTITTSTFISLVTEGTDTVTDGTMFITSWASNSGFADTNAVNVPYKRKAIHLWEYVKAKTDSLYATKSHNHDDRYVKAFGASNDNIDSDWGLSFKTFDPIPSGTPPELNPNISLLSIGNSFNRRKLLAFIYSNDNIYYRRHVDGGFTNWRRLAFANEIPTSLKNPYALTISLNGTSQGPYDGSSAKNINITPSSIGASSSSHTHAYLPLSGGTMTGNIKYIGKGTSYIGNGENDAANGVGGALNNLVISSWYGISFTTSCSGYTYTNKNAVSINCRNGYVSANTFVGTFNGNASTATKLTSSSGNAALPIYFSDGKPVACTASLIFSNLSNSGNNLSITVAGQNRTLTVGYATSAGYANGIANKGLLDSQEKIDNFITANRFEYATFKTTESNNVGFSSNDGIILSMSWSQTAYGAQIAFDEVSSATVKVRGKNTSWGNWYTLLHSGNYNSYSPTLTGKGASGTWGINITGNADTIDGYHISDESRQVYKNYYTVDSPAGAWILIKFPAWDGYSEIVTINGYGDNRHAHCVVYCGSRNQGIWGYQSDYNGTVVDRIRWKEVDSGKFALIVLINEGITTLRVKATNSLEISKTTGDNAAFAISSSFFSSSGVFHGNVDWDKIIGKPSSFTPSAHNHDGRYLRLDGSDTMTGVFKAKANQYNDGYDGAINMNNSDIYGLNSIYTADRSDAQAEGIHFWRDSTHVDTLRMMDGKLLFTPNRPLGGSGTEQTVLHTGNSHIKGGIITINGSSLTPLTSLPSHTHSWTSITDKLVVNEFNIVNAGYNDKLWFNYLPINDRSKTASIQTYIMCNGAKGMASVTASGFIKNGSNSNYVLLGDGGHKLESALSVANADKVDGYHATDGRTFTGNINWSGNWNDTWSDGTNKHPWYGFDHRYFNTGAYSTTISDYFGMTIKTANTLRLDFGTLLLNGTSIYSINVASATKLQTPRNIWGQSFDGTGDVSGSLSGVANILFSADNTYNIGSNSTASKYIYTYWLGAKSGLKLELGANDSSFGLGLCIDTNLNVGIGTNTPIYKLDVKGDIRATGNSYATHFYESSDKTLKKNIKSILSSTNIPKIREFDWKDTGEHSYGFIALELEELGYGCLVNESDGKKTVNYTATLALTVAKLLNLINIQNKKISNLTKELKALKYGRKKNS